MKVKERFEEFRVDSFSGVLYVPGYTDTPCLHPSVYLLGSEEKELREIIRILKKDPILQEREPVLIGIHPGNWYTDYSPFSAPPLTSAHPAFGNTAGDYLFALEKKLIPEIEKSAPVLPLAEDRYLIGYSLAGLCALYGAYISDSFSGYGGVSPSLWLEGWMDFAHSTPLRAHTERLYISIGTKESRTKNPRMARIGDCFETAASCYSAVLGSERFLAEHNPGNHFFEPEHRLAKAISFLLKPM